MRTEDTVYKIAFRWQPQSGILIVILVYYCTILIEKLTMLYGHVDGKTSVYFLASSS